MNTVIRSCIFGKSPRFVAHFNPESVPTSATTTQAVAEGADRGEYSRVRPWETTASRIPRGNAGTRTTLAEMSRLAQEGARDPRVIAAAHEVVRSLPERSDDTTMAGVLANVRRRMRYTPDPIDVELVKSPAALIDECERDPGGHFVGDCDDASVLLAAMLGAIGIHSRFCVIPADKARPGEWSHVYVSARASDGKWIALDPIVRSFGVGEEAPASALSGPRVHFPGAAGMGEVAMLSGVSRYRYRPPYGMAGIGAGDSPDDYTPEKIAAWAAANPAQAAAGGYRAASTIPAGGNSNTIDPTLAAILGVTGSAVNTYLTTKTRGGGRAAQPTYYNPAPPVAPQSSGMSPQTKTLLIAGAAVVGAVVLFTMLRKR